MAFPCPFPDRALAAKDLKIGTSAVCEILAEIVQPVATRAVPALLWGELVAVGTGLAYFKSVPREAEFPLGVDAALLLVLASAALVSGINAVVLGSIIVRAGLGLDFLPCLEDATGNSDQIPAGAVSQACPPRASEGQLRLLLFHRGCSLWQGLEVGVGRANLGPCDGAAIIGLCPLSSRLLVWALGQSLPLVVNLDAVGLHRGCERRVGSMVRDGASELGPVLCWYSRASSLLPFPS